MKPANKSDRWIDRTIGRFMKQTVEMITAKDVNQMPGFREETLLLPSHLLAEATDYLSINDWMQEYEDF